MMKLPFTYAVFYHTIMEPNTTTTQKTINWILFTGEPTPSEHHPAYFKPTVGCGYTSGAKLISKDIIDAICSISVEELARRVSLIKLQDVPAAYHKLLDLIKILDISTELRNELLFTATGMDMESFIGKMFQLSLKGTNKKLRLNDSLKELLHNPDITTIITAPNSDEPIPDSPQSLGQRSLNMEQDLKEMLQYDESRPNPFKLLSSPHTFYQELVLPRDYNLLLQVIAPLIIKPGLIDLDLADIHTAIGFDFEQHTCRPGKLMLIDAMCPLRDYTNLINALPYVSGAQSCILSLTAGQDIELSEVSEITNIVSCNISPDATLIFGADIDETYTENCTIQLICLTEGIPKEDNAAVQDKKQADSSVKKKSTKKKKTSIDVPSFMNR